MDIKTASIFVLISSIMWILAESYWITQGLLDGWLNFFDDPLHFMVRLMSLAPPFALIFLSLALKTISKK